MAWSKKALKGTLSYKGFVFDFEYKKVKYLRLKFNSKGEFKLSIPYGYTQEMLFEFLQKNEAWIEKNATTFKKNAQLNAGKIEILGRWYELEFKTSAKKPFFSQNKLIAKDETQLKEFLHKNARKICLFYVKKWQKHFEEQIKRVSVKMMRTRWGSCNGKKGYVNLSARLIHKPLKAIEYVILHELTHLKFPHHQASFYAHIQALMPDFKQRERLLK